MQPYVHRETPVGERDAGAANALDGMGGHRGEGEEPVVRGFDVEEAPPESKISVGRR
jgi:hypothetical protein